MKKWIIWTIIATILFAVFVHLATIFVMPYVIMNRVMASFPTNKLQVNPLVKASKGQVIPLPCPDFVYTISTYDVAKEPVHLNLVVPSDNYWSLSITYDNGDNIYTLNDRQAPSRDVEVIITRKDYELKDPGKAIVVKSPSNKGLILIRMVVPSQDRLLDLMKIASQARLTVGLTEPVKLAETGQASAVAMKEFTSAEYGFSIKYPSDWQELSQPTSIFYAKPSSPIPTLSVAWIEGATFAEAVKTQLAKSGTSIEVGNAREVTLTDGTKAMAARANWVVRGYPGESYVVGVKKGNKWLIATVTTISAFFAYDEAKFAEIAHTLHIAK
jgi:uncharacterized membrane protein